MFIAKKDFTCGICHKLILKGSTDFRFRRFGKGQWDAIHATCKQAVKQEAAQEAIHGLAQMENSSTNTLMSKEKSNVENAIKDLVSKLVIPQTIDENMVRKIVKEETAKATRTVEFKIADVPAVNVKLAHKCLESLVKLVSIRTHNGHRQNVYLHGPAGSGKSSAAKQVKDILGLERYGYISLNPQTPDSRILGFVHAGGHYVETEFFRCYVNGGVFCIDEIDNASASLLTTLNGLLENGHAAFPHGVFERHADFLCIATANTIGRGGDIQYPERRALDGATLERFIFLEWGYDEVMTRSIVAGIIGDKADELIRWVDETGKRLQASNPTLIVSPRAYIQSATLEANGFSRDQIKASVIARGLR